MSSDCDDGLAGVFSPQQPHEGSWHVFKAFGDVLLILQFALQMHEKNTKKNYTKWRTLATQRLDILLKTQET